MYAFENVKEALDSLIEFAEAGECYRVTLEGAKVLASQEDVLEIVREHAYSIADLLGMEDLYLKNIRTIHD